MKHTCPNPECASARIKKAGTYYRTSDHQTVQRFRCCACSRNFSEATGTPEFGQNKRQLNQPIMCMLASSSSQNRLALNLGTNRKTIARKLAFLGAECARKNRLHNEAHAPAKYVQFDEMETFEHTKCKPLSIALAVEDKVRRIIGVQVSLMPCKGPLAEVSRKKYGHRTDERRQGLESLFQDMAPLCSKKLHLLSDKCPRYMPIVQKFFKKRPEFKVNYAQTKGARGCSTAQGELKKLEKDPLWSLNHTCAMFRAWVNRLFRRTWNTTKKVENLVHHLQIYAYYHNTVLLKEPIGEAV